MDMLQEIYFRHYKNKKKLSWGKDNFKLLGINFNADLDKMFKGNYTDKIKFLEKQQFSGSSECYHQLEW